MSIVGRTEHVHNVQQKGAGVHTHCNVLEIMSLQKMQKKHYIPCRCMHEGETFMQSGEKLAVLVVCVCVFFFRSNFFKHTHTLYLMSNTHNFPLPFSMMQPSLSFNWLNAICVCP